MPSAVRVVCSPVVTLLPEVDPFVEAALIRLTRRGGGNSLVTETPQPAKLQFGLSYLEQVRGAAVEHEPYAFLQGTIQLTGIERLPVFTLSDEGFQFEGENPSEQGIALRSVAFSFDVASFSNAPENTAKEARLLLPQPEKKGIRLAELSVSLLVNGQEEASSQHNDTLDLCLGPEPFRLRLRFPETEDVPQASFVLRREADGFEQTRNHGDDLEPAEDKVELLYDSVLPDQRYSLTLVTPQGRRRTLLDRTLEPAR